MYQFQYITAVDLADTLIGRLTRCPRQPDVLCYGTRLVSAALLRTWLKLYHRFTIEGRENLPQSGPFVLVANHASHLDALCLLSALPMSKLHEVYPAAAADYFFSSVPRMALSAVCMNAVPFHRLEHVRQSMAACREILRSGNVLILFPEGTRTTDGKVGAFRRGIGQLVAGRNVPVVPCHLEGTFRAMPKGTLVPRPRKLTLRIGRPMRFSDRTTAKQDTIDIANELWAAVCALEEAAS